MRFQLPAAAFGAVLLLATLFGAAGRVAAEDLTVTLAVKDAGFVPPEVEVPAGSRVRLEVVNETGAAIEFESFELNRERVVQPGQRVNVYVSGLAAGRYEFFDDFHQQRRGVLVVK